jgi:hypothetical protein
MDLSGYNNLFSESLLILQIAECFRCKLWTVSAEKDCDELLGAISTRGIVNYDAYAQKNESEKIVLEMKFVPTPTTLELSQILKLAVPRNAEGTDRRRSTPRRVRCAVPMSPTRKSPFGTRSRATSIESGDASKPAPRARKQVAPPHRDRTPRRVPASPR